MCKPLDILAPSQYKDGPSMYGYFQYKDMTVVRPSYFQVGIPLLVNQNVYIKMTLVCPRIHIRLTIPAHT